MKKNVFTLFALLVSTFLYAQVRVGVDVGANFSKMPVTLRDATKDVTSSYTARTTFSLGVLAAYDISEHFGVQSGLYVKGKGGTSTFNNNSFSVDFKATYLELPILLSYKIPIGKGSISPFAGPYFSYLLGGTARTKVNVSGASKEETKNLKAGDEPKNYKGDNAYIKGLDAGLTLGGEFTLGSGLFLRMNYSLGLRNLIPATDSSSGTLKNSCFGISIGYWFKNKDK